MASAVPSRMLLVATVISVSKSGPFTPAVPSQCFVLMKHSECSIGLKQVCDDLDVHNLVGSAPSNVQVALTGSANCSLVVVSLDSKTEEQLLLHFR